MFSARATKRAGIDHGDFRDFSVLCSLTLAAPAMAAGITPEQKCASAKMKAVGKKFAAKAKCYAKALSQSADVVADCLTLAETKFVSAFTKEDSKDGCLHENDAATIETKIDQTLNDIVGDLGCGNGRLDGDEQCDEGPVATATCSATCTPIEAVCGNGVIDGAEECDDSDAADGDGCSAACAVESGFNCTGQPSVCTPL